MKHLKIFDNFNRDEYWDDYLDKLNANLKKSQEDSQRNWDEHFRLIDQDEAHEWMIKMSDVTKEDFNLVVSSLGAIKYEIITSLGD